MECQKCKKALPKKGAQFKCTGTCQGTFHKSCVKGLAADLKAGKTRLYCNNCGGEDSDTDEIDDTNNNVLKEINQKINIIKDVKKQLITLTESMEFLSEKYEILLAEHTQSKDRIEKLEKCVTTLNNKTTYLEKCNGALEEKIQEMQQKSRQYNIEIVGVEQLPEENMKDMMEKIGALLKVNTEHIYSFKRLLSRNKSKPPPIMVRFRNDDDGYAARELWLTQRRLVKIVSNQITLGSSQDRVYVNEDLTRDMRDLLWKAKTELKDKYQFVWVRNGRVYAKKDTNAKPLWVRSESDIAELKDK
ncbi:hypothetical protein JYU34_009431 [Plutella xylostella]|uniref:FP protein C-terminal domain-containing protein n=1 Tax=Plutella xylostella TaxID=51655 RepID=A0ABQ7QJF4_PLUXY|nr:uncharacterized protein LOC119693584 [Plutella xylostella]KAG7305368.1 hypothetical protein JYU34_009431 [Plutella xylostella]